MKKEVEKRRRGRGDEMNMIVNCDCELWSIDSIEQNKKSKTKK